MRAESARAMFVILFALLAFACSNETGKGSQITDDSDHESDGTETSPGDTDSGDDSEIITDDCPDNPAKTEPGVCGCDTPEGSCCDTMEAGSVKMVGAEYYFFAQQYSENLDIDGLTPDDTRIIQIIPKQIVEPAVPGDHFVVLKGYIKLDQGSTYEFSPGWEDSTFNVMTVSGQEVHRKNLGETERQITPIYLSEGYHPFKIIFFKAMGELVIWMNGDRMNDQHLWHDEPFSKELETRILGVLGALKDHVNGNTLLNETQLSEHAATLEGNYSTFGINKAILLAANDLITTYEDKIGPLFIGEQTKDGFDRNNWKTDIHKIIFYVSQAIIDYVYTTENVGKCAEILEGMGFRTADYFPGKVTSEPDPERVHQAQISASYVKTFGHPVMHAERPARKPTGTYLAPGTIAKVTVPEALVGKGFAIRIGAHSWDLSHRPPVKRLDRVSITYDIVNRQTLVASPLGGNIYIEVPFLADEGIVKISIQNAVRSPYFSAKSFHATTLSEWKETERKSGAPWADFQSEKFMMNVPTNWISNLEDPVTLMKDWDMAMDAMNDLMGYPPVVGKETMYPQVDVILRASVHSPGYPSVNQKYDPNRDYGGNGSSHLVTGPRHAPDFEFHEQGHGYLFVKYGGESESAVNLLHVAVWNQKFDFTLDEAFRASRGFNNNEHRTLDNTAVAWMTSFNFCPRKVPMHSSEKAYQLKGHAKFVDIARLFGWKPLNDFWYSINEDYENGNEWSKDGTPSDTITLRLSEKAEVDLRPLLHFWGIHPENPAQLAADIAAKKLPASADIYDTLLKYKSLVPSNNSAFQDFALKWWGKQPSVNGAWTETEHARQWDSQEHLDKWPEPVRPNGEIYDETAASELRATVQDIIDLYFPSGRP